MAINVCDAIMGSGKSSAAINYMNSNPGKRFIYITPYLEESIRIQRACPELNFKEPSNKISEFNFKKFKHTEALIRSGENITSTHNMFLRYSNEMLDMIRENGYTLIIDEAVDVFRSTDIRNSDMQLLKEAGWAIEESSGEITITPPSDYDGVFINDIINLSKGNRIVNIETEESSQCLGDKNNSFYYWVFSREIFDAFEDIIVLTYMFEAQYMKYYFDMNNINFNYIGISYNMGVYEFCDRMNYIPEYTKTLSGKIHIVDNKKLNAIGNNKNALSANWYSKSTSSNKEKRDELKRNISNFFINYNRDKSVSRRLWAAFKTGEKFVRGKGYYYSNIAFNSKATNDYKDRDVLAYCVNIFIRPDEKFYLTKNGIDVLEERYALSIMVQWIWRSAIRDGKEIWIYIPSKRMRNLLIDWIQEVENLWTTLQ